jgi:hypothetical protein
MPTLNDLAAAHAAEVAERSVAFDAAKELMARDLRKAEALADTAVGLLWEYRSAPKFGDDKPIRATIEIEDRIDAFLTQPGAAP